jgi:hypothetical protein
MSTTTTFVIEDNIPLAKRHQIFPRKVLYETEIYKHMLMLQVSQSFLIHQGFLDKLQAERGWSRKELIKRVNGFVRQYKQRINYGSLESPKSFSQRTGLEGIRVWRTG